MQIAHRRSLKISDFVKRAKSKELILNPTKILHISVNPKRYDIPDKKASGSRVWNLLYGFSFLREVFKLRLGNYLYFLYYLYRYTVQYIVGDVVAHW